MPEIIQESDELSILAKQRVNQGETHEAIKIFEDAKEKYASEGIELTESVFFGYDAILLYNSILSEEYPLSRWGKKNISYISKACFELHLGIDVVKEASEILFVTDNFKKSHNDFLPRRKPETVGSGIIYAAAKHLRKYRSGNDFKEVAGLTSSAVSYIFKDVCRKIGIDITDPQNPRKTDFYYELLREYKKGCGIEDKK